VLQREVADRLARAILEGSLTDGDRVVVDVNAEGDLIITAGQQG
jgi:hypothetical protein